MGWGPWLNKSRRMTRRPAPAFSLLTWPRCEQSPSATTKAAVPNMMDYIYPRSLIQNKLALPKFSLSGTWLQQREKYPLHNFPRKSHGLHPLLHDLYPASSSLSSGKTKTKFYFGCVWWGGYPGGRLGDDTSFLLLCNELTQIRQFKEHMLSSHNAVCIYVWYVYVVYMCIHLRVHIWGNMYAGVCRRGQRPISSVFVFLSPPYFWDSLSLNWERIFLSPTAILIPWTEQPPHLILCGWWGPELRSLCLQSH